MSPAHAPRRFLYASLAAATFILYGSLYPFRFHDASVSAALEALFLSHHMHDQPFSGLIANIVLYVPLGLFAAAAQSSDRPAWRRLTIATAIGGVLCLCVETLQFFDADRITTLTDVYPNVAGTLIGALLSLSLGGWLRRHAVIGTPARQIAALLLLSFLAARLFPYVPTIDLHAYWQAIKPVVLYPSVDGFALASYIVSWMVVAALLADLFGVRRSRGLILAAMLAMLSAKVLITHNQLSLSELVALPVAVFGWRIVSIMRRPAIGVVLAALLALVIAGERLLPFNWQPVGHDFGWIPFFSILHGSMATNTQALTDKLFLYASLVWLLAMAGLRYVHAGALVAAGLFATSLIETHLPGRSAEITDAVIAIAAAVVLSRLAVPTATDTACPEPLGRPAAPAGDGSCDPPDLSSNTPGG